MTKNILTLLLIILSLNISSLAFADHGKFGEEMVLAEKLLNQSKLHQAKAVYFALLAKDPDYEPAILALGTVYSREAEYVEAEKMFLKVLNKNSNSANGYERLAYNYYLWAADNKESYNFLLNKASEAIKKALNIDKYNAQVYSTYGLICIENNQYDKALENFHKALNIDPTNQEIYTNMGLLYTHLKDYDLALQQFQRAININTSSPRPYKKLGEMLSEAGQHRQAVEYFNKGRFYDVFTTYQEHFFLAENYEKLGNLKEAINEFTEVVKLKPGYVDCYTHMARLFETVGEEDKSLEAYRKAIELDPNIMTELISQAQNYLRTEDFIHARPMFIKILKIDPKNQNGFDGLCSLHYFMSILGKLDTKNWYFDKPFIQERLANLIENNHLAQLSWEKFLISKDGLSDISTKALQEQSKLELNTPEDYAAKGEALFLLHKYSEANSLFLQAIDKYTASYTQEGTNSEAVKRLLSLGDRLYTDHELLASREIYNKVLELDKNDTAVNGLSVIATTREKAESMLVGLSDIKQTPDYQIKLIEALKQVIGLFPQSAEAHFRLSNIYAKQQNYTLALDELVIYNDLKTLTPFNGAPKNKNVEKLIDKYFMSVYKATQKKLEEENTKKNNQQQGSIIKQ